MVHISTLVYASIAFFIIGFVFSLIVFEICMLRQKTFSKDKGKQMPQVEKPEIRTDFEQPEMSVDGHTTLSEFNKLPPIK